MNPICDMCTYQENGPIWEGKVRCGRASYTYGPEGHGPFKGGAVCVHDSDLQEYFKPRTGSEISIKNQSTLLASQFSEISELKYQVSLLKSRLTKVE